MKKILLLVLILPLLAACNGKAVRKSLPTSECLNAPHSLPEVNGYTATAIAYGDSYLVVIPLSEIRPHTEFRFGLAPKSRSDKDPAYEAAWVTISGGKLENDGSISAASWLDVSGQLAARDTLIACVPNLTPGDKYKYKVTISDKELTEADVEIFGYIDPRADIIE